MNKPACGANTETVRERRDGNKESREDTRRIFISKTVCDLKKQVITMLFVNSAAEEECLFGSDEKVQQEERAEEDDGDVRVNSCWPVEN